MSLVVVTTLIDIVGLVVLSVCHFSHLFVGAFLLLLSLVLVCVCVCVCVRVCVVVVVVFCFLATFDILWKVTA